MQHRLEFWAVFFSCIPWGIDLTLLLSVISCGELFWLYTGTSACLLDTRITKITFTGSFPGHGPREEIE